MTVFLSRKSRGQKSLGGYSSWGHKESDMIYQLCMHRHIGDIEIGLKNSVY